MPKKTVEGRLVWYEHGMRRGGSNVGRSDGDGQGEWRWMGEEAEEERGGHDGQYTIIGDNLRGKGLTGDKLTNRTQWRRLVRNADLV